MIIQSDIKEKKTCYFSDLDAGDIFSYEYPPTDILMKLPEDEILFDENEDRVRAIYLDNGSAKDRDYYEQKLVYPLTGKLIITG